MYFCCLAFIPKKEIMNTVQCTVLVVGTKMKIGKLGIHLNRDLPRTALLAEIIDESDISDSIELKDVIMQKCLLFYAFRFS